MRLEVRERGGSVLRGRGKLRRLFGLKRLNTRAWRSGAREEKCAVSRINADCRFEVSRVIPQQEGEGLGQRNHDEFRAAPAANAHAPGPDSVRRDSDSTGGADVCLRRAKRTGERPRGVG